MLSLAAQSGYTFTLFLFMTFHLVAPAVVMHSHDVHGIKERESDGAYNPRDRDHYSNSGEHHSEFDHEAILGNVKEAEEFDHLSPDESKRRLGILLINMDLNGDKYIDKNELKAWIMRSFKMLSEEEAKERLEDADDNNDGKITWEEYVADAYGMDESEESQNSDNIDPQLLTDDKIMWRAADLNGDNILDSNEWVTFSHPEEHPSMLPHILEQTLREKDQNKDGFIDFQEFIGERGENQDREWLRMEKEKFDYDLDKNGDGHLGGNEILSWVVPSNEEIAEEEVIHLFAASDDDHDDVLSFDEILEHHDTFVGSEATDYGDHLHNIHHFVDEL